MGKSRLNARILTLSLLTTLAIGPSALAQGSNYNYRSGDSRVIIQSETGLANPSSTYIGAGTLSQSARGVINTGAQVNPGLPKVNRGGYLGTPGDNLYGANPIYSRPPMQASIRRQPRSNPAQGPRPSTSPKEYTYIPGQQGALEYPSTEAEPALQIDKAARSGDQSALKNPGK